LLSIKRLLFTVEVFGALRVRSHTTNYNMYERSPGDQGNDKGLLINNQPFLSVDGCHGCDIVRVDLVIAVRLSSVALWLVPWVPMETFTTENLYHLTICFRVDK
jgi:hypothetical protein